MKDRIFVDTNLLIYLYSKEIEKEKIIYKVLSDLEFEIVISSQVISEFSNVLLKKFRQTKETIRAAIDDFEKNFNFVAVDYKIITKALEINERYKYSFFDSLIIAAAINSSCNFLYSEDMQHDQQIENLKIRNPFKVN